MTTRNDPRYVDHYDSDAILIAWYGEIPMGGWTGLSKDEFRLAVEDELRHVDDNAEDPVDFSLIEIEAAPDVTFQELAREYFRG